MSLSHVPLFKSVNKLPAYPNFREYEVDKETWKSIVAYLPTRPIHMFLYHKPLEKMRNVYYDENEVV